MKKIFTLITSLMLLGTMAAMAQTWDFTKGFSDATKANLKADAANWDTNRTDATTGEVTGWKNKTVQEGIQMANGSAIPELDGIFFVKGFAVGNTLLDPTSIRLGGKSQKLTFKGLKSGQTLTVLAKSANATATNRALVSYTTELEYTDGPANGICYGNQVEGAPADGIYTLVWTVNTENPDGVDVTFGTGSASGGIDIQKIIVKGGLDEAKNIAYITGIADYDNEDYFYITMTGMTGINSTVYNENSTDVTAETLREFDAVVVGPSVSSSSVLGQLVQEQLSFMPIVNLNTGLFGYQPVLNESVYLTALDQENPILEGVDFDGESFTYFEEEPAPAVALPTTFASDNVVAVAGENMDAVMIHQHNATRNSYVFINSEAGEEGMGIDYDAWSKIAENAIKVVAPTKKQVAAAAAPVIASQYGDGQTTVTISSSTPGAKVFFKYEGDETFKPYTEAILLTEGATIIAYAEAEGYLTSSESKSTIIVKTMAASPVIKVESTTEKATVTIEAAEGVKVYYNFSGSAKTEESALYTEPFDITTVQTTTVYAFATSDVMLDSEIASAEATLEVKSETAAKVRLDEIAHCDFNAAEWFTAVEPVCTEKWGGNGKESAYYYWGKNAWNYYKLDEEGKRINLGSEEEPVYIPNPDALKTVEPGNGWIIKSYGQASTYEGIASAGGVANGRTGRYADSIEDLVAGEPSKGLIDFGGKTSGDPYSMSVETTAKYAGPFDIVTYLGNGSTSDLGIEAQVSTDGVNWETVGALNYTTSQRYWKRTKLCYEGTDEVYVRVAQVSGGSKGQLYDIILLNNGEKSKEYTPVIEREAEEAVVNQNRVVAKGGQLFIETVDGKVITIAAQRVK